MKTLANLAGKFEKLLSHLPGAIRKPVEREWTPLKELFLHQRPPRILVIGADAKTFIESVLPPEQPGPEAGLIETDSPWHTYQHRGSLQFAIADESGRFARTILLDAQPDLFLLLTRDANPDLALLRELHRFDRERHPAAAPIIAIGPQPPPLLDLLCSQEDLRASVATVLPWHRREPLLAAIASALPGEARLEFARVTGEKTVQRDIAATLTRSTAAICTAIGAQPIPLADFPILTTLQTLMISGIIHAAGGEWNRTTLRNFLGALGINVGAGLLLREGARAAVKLLPGFGNAISGAVAGAGTMALGRAATAYFIDGNALEEARKHLKS